MLPKKIRFLNSLKQDSSPTYVQIWLNTLVDVHQTTYLIELEKKTLSLQSMEQNFPFVSFYY
jgi:hypothetical protein